MTQSSQTGILGTLKPFIMHGTPEDVVRRYAALPQYAADSCFGEYDSNVVVIDTETTGISFNHDELTQIAAARVENGEISDWFITFVNPGKSIPEDVAHLTDIHDEDVANAPTPQEALADLVRFVGNAKLVAHNAEFDKTFVTRHPEGYPLLENEWVDSLDLSRIALPRMKSHRLIDLVTAFGAPRSTHRADDDVAATCALLRILLAAVDSMPYELLDEIGRMATAEDWSTSELFRFFAERKKIAFFEEVTSASDDFASGQLFPKLPTFSLSKLRRNRLCRVETKPRRDANDFDKEGMPLMVFPAERDIDTAFSPDGLMGHMYEDYETRQEQLAMARAVRDSAERSQNLEVEAGTGVGKSMAYLVPLSLTALRNNITVGVATKTNTLLDQLVYKELPALASALAQEFEEFSGEKELTFAALKGFSHYPCLRRIKGVIDAGPRKRLAGTQEKAQAPALAALVSFIEQTEYDDLDGLKIDYRVLPRKVITTSSNECLRRKCPFFGTSCFVHGARRRAESVDVVVTNHSLLFCDIAADGGLLPPVRYWAVDEAHGAENEARRALSLEISTDELANLAHRVAGGESSRDVFSRAERSVTLAAGGESEALFFGLLNKAKSAGAEFAESEAAFVLEMRGLLYFDPVKRGKGYDRVELWINQEIRSSSVFAKLASAAETMVEKAEKLITASQNLMAFMDDIEGAAAAQHEVAVVAIELKELIKACEVILFSGPDAYVYSANMSRRNDRGGDKLEALPYNVGGMLNETLYANTKSVVFASATLTVDDSFASFETAMGLNQGEESQVRELLLDSSYDFNANMTIYVAQDMPEPQDPQYLKRLQELLIRAHVAQRGSMLTLFTNRKEMEKCFDEVQPALKSEDLRLICQKWGVSVKGLRDDFLADEHLSLFALKSFWEGFDAPGSTLRGVIIPKLPFSKPTDPLSCERASRDDAAWRRYVLPAAVLETKQAAGRLIRKADDKGILILADKRLVSKGYGKSFLRSMPSRNIKICTIDEIIADITQG